MKKSTFYAGTLFLFLVIAPAFAQHHMSNWIYRNATDTTEVPCWTDSLTMIYVPPSSMSMMMPSSMYMRIDQMPMDSLMIQHDSTYIGWYRIIAGSDSMHFDMMNNDSTYGSRNMMQFMMSMKCQFHWDSLKADSAHRSWHPTGMKGWNGSAWLSMTGISFLGNVASFQSSESYSAVAFVGANIITAVTAPVTAPMKFALMQNYPNPFNPSTVIHYVLPNGALVTLKVFNILGQEVAMLVNEFQTAGSKSVQFNGSSLTSGIYLYQLQAGDFTVTKKLVLIR